MPTYVLLSKLTPEGRRTLHSNPARMEEVNEEIEACGSVLAAWAGNVCFGCGSLYLAARLE